MASPSTTTATHMIPCDAVRYSRFVRECILRALNLNKSSRSTLLNLLPAASQTARRTPKGTAKGTTKSTRPQRARNRRNAAKPLPLTSWLTILPPDLQHRIAMLCARDDKITLLNLTEATSTMRAAVQATLQNTLILDEQTMPQISRWAKLFHANLYTLHIDKRLRKYNASITLPPLLHLLSTPTLRHAKIPAMGRLLAILARSKTLASLGVYIRNRDDVHEFLKAGTPLSRPFTALCALSLHCVSHDEKISDPFCFSAHCATEALTTDSALIALVRKYGHINQLTLTCFHNMSCDLWPIIRAFKALQTVNIEAPLQVPQDGVNALRRMDSVSLVNIRQGARLAANVGDRMTKLVLNDRALTQQELAALSTCRRLTHLQVVLEAGAETALEELAPRLTTMALRWAYADVDLTLARTHGRSNAIEWHKPAASTLHKLTSGHGLETLHLELVQIEHDVLHSVLHAVTRRLRKLVISLEGQAERVDMRLLALLRSVQTECRQLEALHFYEVSEGTEHRYDVLLQRERKCELQNGVRVLRSRAPLLNTDAVEEAVARMCGRRRVGWSWV